MIMRAVELVELFLLAATFAALARGLRAVGLRILPYRETPG